MSGSPGVEPDTGRIATRIMANAGTAKRLLARIIPEIPDEAGEPEHRALDSALITAQEDWPTTHISCVRDCRTMVQT